MKSYWPEPNSPARILFTQAAFASASDKPVECLHLLRDAHSKAVQDFGPAHVSTLNIAQFLVAHLRHQGMPHEARASAQRSLLDVKGNVGIPVSIRLAILCELRDLTPAEDAESLRRQREQAEQLIQEHLAQELDLPPIPEPSTEVQRLIFEALDFYQAGKKALMEASFMEAYRLGVETLGSNHPHTLWALSELAAIDLNHGRLKRAEERRCLVLDLAMQSEGAAGQTVLRTCVALARLYGALGEYQAEEHFRRRAIAIEERREVPGPKTYHLARCLALQGRTEEARILFWKVVSDGCEWFPEAWIRPDSHPDWWHLAYLDQGCSADVARVIQHLDARIARAVDAEELQSAVDVLDDKTAMLTGLRLAQEAEATAIQAETIRKQLRDRDTSDES